MFRDWAALEKTRILVIGDVMLDQYWHGFVSRISPEAPVPVVSVKESSMHLGGAGNVCANLASLGVSSTLYASVGPDGTSTDIAKMLKESKITNKLQEFSNYKTIKKLRTLSEAHQLLRMDFEDSSTQGHELDYDAIDLDGYQVLIISDYCKGGVNDPQALIKRAKKAGVRVCVDTKKTDLSVYRGADLLKPNRVEFKALGGCCDSLESIEASAKQILSTYDLSTMLVTLGKEGMLLVDKTDPAVHFAPKAREVFDVTGAGDTVIATLAALWSAGANLSVAAGYANQAAACVVGRLGTSAVSLDDLKYTENGLITDDELDVDELLRVIKKKTSGKRLVMTNGCFDFLHAGHVQYLAQARALGDCLLVAVNTDDSVKRLKGESRPINTLLDRLMVLQALKSVDYVIPFSSDTPAELIKAITPAVLVKGGDYTVEEIAGSDHVLKEGGEVRILPLRDGCSSTRIIDSLQK